MLGVIGMEKDGKRCVMLIPILIVLAIALLAATLLFLKLRAERDTSRRLENTISHMQDEEIIDLLTRVQRIMNGEKLRGITMGERHGPCLSETFALNDHFLEIYPTLYTIQSWITIFEINLDGDVGEIWLR
jgi:hypothetical protein